MSNRKTKSTTPNANVPLELMNELYRAYDFFNDHFCKGALPRPMLLITQHGKKKAYGWFAGDCWNQQGKEMSEISIHASAFMRPAHVFNTLLHEMAHLKNFYDNDRKFNVDCTDQQRHNQIFKTTAEFFGLSVQSSKRFGFGHTELDSNSLKAIELLKPNLELFKLAAQMQKKEKKETKTNLTPTMVDKETKQAIKDAAEKLGISQKEVVSSGVNLLVQMPDRMTALATAIFGKKFKTIEDLTAVIVDIMMPKKVEEPVKVEPKKSKK